MQLVADFAEEHSGIDRENLLNKMKGSDIYMFKRVRQFATQQQRRFRV